MNKFQYLLVIFLLTVQVALDGAVYWEKPANFHSKHDIAGCFIEYKNRVLFLHRQEDKTEGNCWGVPGGKVKRNESLRMAINREVFEETGYDISNQPLVFLGTAYIKGPANDYVYHMFSYKPAEYPGDVKINFFEHKGYTWVTPQDALTMNLMSDEDFCVNFYINQ